MKTIYGMSKKSSVEVNSKSAGMDISVRDFVMKSASLRFCGFEMHLEGKGDSSVKFASTGNPKEMGVSHGKR